MPDTEVTPYIKRLADIKKQATRQAGEIIEELQNLIIPYVRDRQLYQQGIDGKGERLQDYKPLTVIIKRAKGQPTDRTTLLDSGAFYRGFFASSKNDLLVITSKDSKTPDLLAKYGPDIFTLTVEHNKEVNEKIILPALIEWLLKQIDDLEL